jgi:hypothetical protein
MDTMAATIGAVVTGTQGVGAVATDWGEPI